MKRTAMMAAMLAAAMTVSFTGAVYAGETETSTEAATEADGAGMADSVLRMSRMPPMYSRRSRRVQLS